MEDYQEHIDSKDELMDDHPEMVDNDNGEDDDDKEPMKPQEQGSDEQQIGRQVRMIRGRRPSTYKASTYQEVLEK